MAPPHETFCQDRCERKEDSAATISKAKEPREPPLALIDHHQPLCQVLSPSLIQRVAVEKAVPETSTFSYKVLCVEQTRVPSKALPGFWRRGERRRTGKEAAYRCTAKAVHSVSDGFTMFVSTKRYLCSLLYMLRFAHV